MIQSNSLGSFPFVSGGRISNKLRETCRMLLNNVPGANERVFISGEHMYFRAESALGITGKAIKWSKNVSKLSSFGCTFTHHTSASYTTSSWLLTQLSAVCTGDADSEQQRSHRHRSHRRCSHRTILEIAHPVLSV